ncbi:MAG: 50S ribosomal protein L17 [Candidatus Omnitrophota bacterium]
MRHGKRRTRFGRQKSHRAATLRNMAKSVLLHSRIKTTHVKAKEARRVVEKLITIAKTNSVAARRRAYAVLGERELVSLLFGQIAPLFRSRNGGYTRIIPFNFRKGDGATTVFLELTEKKEETKTKVVKKIKKAEKAAVKPNEVKKEAAKIPEKKVEKATPAIDLADIEEKAVERPKKEKAREETRKMEKQKGFLRKMKGFFRRKTNM